MSNRQVTLAERGELRRHWWAPYDACDSCGAKAGKACPQVRPCLGRLRGRW